MGQDEFPLVLDYIQAASGMRFDPSKKLVIESRLSPLLEKYKCATFLELCNKSKNNLSTQTDFIDAITINETYFFRDTHPFQTFKTKFLPEAIDRKGLRLPVRAWSAASSTGQEAYSMAMAALEILGEQAYKAFNITATDISDEVVTKASRGIYSKIDVQRGLTDALLNRFFIKEEPNWKVKDEVRALIRFSKFNLMESFTALPKFDIVFCRFVAIYFPQEQRLKLWKKIHDQLEPQGILLLGGSEILSDNGLYFERKIHNQTIYYQKKT